MTILFFKIQGVNRRMSQKLDKSIAFREEVKECLADHSGMLSNTNREMRLVEAEEILRELFLINGDNYDKPGFEEIVKAMKIAAARELKTGKDTKTISANFLKIAKKIEKENVYV